MSHLHFAAMADPELTADQKREWVSSHLEADLQHVFNECGVSISTQHALGQHYRSTLRFSTIADTRQDVRAALRADFALEPNTAANRSEISAVVAAWESSKFMVSEDLKVRTEAKHLGLTRPLAQSERSAMVKALETVKGETIADRDLPSNEYLAQLLEMIEQDDVSACYLDEVISKKDAGSLSMQTSIDSAGRLRIARQRPKGQLPAGTEELRQKLRIEANAWLMLSAKLRNKHFLHNLEARHFEAFTDYLLGPKCYSMEVIGASGEKCALKPQWSILLQYEFELRKAAYKKAHRENVPLKDTLRQVCENSELKELYFTSPVALSAQTFEPPSKVPRTDLKGGGKHNRFESKSTADYTKGGGRPQKGKGKGKPSIRVFPNSSIAMVSATPDGRQICYSYNTPGSKCDGRCKRVHICRAMGCGQKHPVYEHPGANTSQGGTV